MCEQYRDALGLQIGMLRPDHIVDSISGRNRQAALTSSDVLDTQGETGWVRPPAGLRLKLATYACLRLMLLHLEHFQNRCPMDSVTCASQ